MQFSKTNLIIYFGIASLLLVPVSAYAQCTASNSLCFQDPLNTGSSEAREVVIEIIFRIVQFFLAIAASLTLLTIMVTGVRYILGALGSEQEIAKAKQMLVWAIVGLMIIGLSAVILWTARYLITGAQS
jgi:hypothetical protein